MGIGMETLWNGHRRKEDMGRGIRVVIGMEQE